MFEWLPITKAADYEQLVDLLDSTEYGLRDVVDWLSKHLNGKVAGILIEFPYIDKDYRSTYYHYYAKKGRPYSAHSARLHFFPKGWSLSSNPLTLGQPTEGTTPSDTTVSKEYLGFMTLRPTRIYTIGRTVLDPSAMKDVTGSSATGTRLMSWGIALMPKVSLSCSSIPTSPYALIRPVGRFLGTTASAC